MKICIITSSYPMNFSDPAAAAGMFVKDLGVKLSAMNHEVFIFTHNRKGKTKDDKELNVTRFEWLGGDKPLARLNPLKPSDSIKMFSLLKNGKKELLKLIASQGIDYCLAMWAVPSGWWAYEAKKSLKVPYTVWALGSDIWTYGKFPIVKSVIKNVLINAESLYADGIKLADDVQKLSGQECEFLPTTRMLPVLSNDVIKIKENNNDIIHFLFIGRYEKAKGPDILLEAFNLLLKERKDVKLSVFGGGTLKSYLTNLIKKYNIEENVSLNGYADRVTAVTYLKKSDCLVIPSRIESIPIIFSDAMKMDRPVIVTDVGDMGELIRRYQVGLVVPPENPVELCRAMSDFIEDIRNKNRSYRENIDKARKIFDLKEITTKLMASIKTK